jgi:hypothetical protein
MKEYQITKYDPQYRDSSGHYTRDEWTSYSDVGDLVSLEEYLATEKAYVDAAVALLRESGVDALQAVGVENHRGAASAPAEGATLREAEWPAAFRSVLREDWWCRFECPTGFVHFGYDYYMYVGVRRPEGASIPELSRLFVEPCTSPYHHDPEDDG